MSRMLVRLSALSLIVVSAMASFALPASAADPPGAITIRASVDGRPVAEADSNKPVVIDPTVTTEIPLQIHNGTDRDLEIQRVRFFGRALGLTLVAQDVVQSFTVGARSTVTYEFRIEPVDLERQATGLLPAGISIYDHDRNVLAEELFVVDIRGSAFSVLGVFAVFVTLASALGIVGIVVAVQRRTLGPSRTRRTVRFGFVGLGIGLTAIVGLAVFRVIAPTGIVWIPLAIIPTVVAAALGFASPGPLRIEDEDERDEPDGLVVELDDEPEPGEGLPGVPPPFKEPPPFPAPEG